MYTVALSSKKGLELSPLMVRFLRGCRPYFVEFVGTFILCLTVCCSLMTPNWNWTPGGDEAGGAVPSFVSPWAPLAIGCALMISIYMGGHISGGHYNPAVSLAVYLSGREKLPLNSLIFYLINQFLAGIIAGLLAYAIFHNSPNVPVYMKNSTGRIFAAELLGTLILAIVVLQVGTSKKIAGNNYFGIAIGFTLIAMGSSLGQISGAFFNPAAASAVFLCQDLDYKLNTKASYVYYLAQLCAALVAPIFYFFMNVGEEYYVKEVMTASENLKSGVVDKIPSKAGTVRSSLSISSENGDSKA